MIFSLTINPIFAGNKISYMSIKGTLIPIGGNENKGVRTSEKFTIEYINKSILARVVKESGGKNSFFVVITTATSIPAEVSVMYKKAFERLGCTNVQMLDIRSREESEAKENIALIKKADCVMFSGGDQSNITRYIGGTIMHKILLERLADEEFVIAGTSAGAMCMSQEMITGSDPRKPFIKGSLHMGEGMGFIHNIIFDSHFIRRRRFGRLASAVAKFPNLIGIGLDEDTGLVIKDCNMCEIIGTGMVILFDPSRVRYNNQSVSEVGETMSLTNLRTHILANGDRFDIKQNKIKISPAHIVVDAQYL